MNYLEKLNPEQRDAVLHTDGPLLILAGAGSGKTRVLTFRIAYMIEEKGVNPWNILAITFTNKAAQEMKERVGQLIGSTQDMWISTFHAACARILRKDIERLDGYKKNFVIFDTKDQEAVVKDCLKELNLNEKNFPFKAVIATISNAKNLLEDPASFAKKNSHDIRARKLSDIYTLYQKKLKKNNALDFDDILFKAVELLANNPDILEYYQNKFKYIMVDEYQDTNNCQYRLVSLLARKHRNLCVVGDDDQCVPEGTMIRTNQGEIPIEKLRTGMEVTTAVGFGEISKGTLDKISKKRYEGNLIKVTTSKGKVLTATPYHITFGSLNIKEDVFYVYLMYKKNFGYRIGQTQGIRNRKIGSAANGLAIRLNGEKADKMWILKVCRDKGEATYYEELLSVKYSIPKVCFHEKGRNMSLSAEQIRAIFTNINTIENAEKLMNDFYLLPEYPHHIASAVIRGQTVRRNVYISYFSGKKTTEGVARAHRISLITSGEEYREQFEKSGFSTRYSKEKGWRIETERKKYKEAEKFAQQLVEVDKSLELYRKAKLTKDGIFMFIPFGSLRKGMRVAICEDGELVEDIIADIDEIEYSGYVYDLSIPDYRQFVANDILVHNCIYSWRGADIRNILDFEKDFRNTKVIKLEQNYRSTQTILDAANAVISRNPLRKAKSLWTDNGTGNNIVLYEAQNERDEANFIASEMQYVQSAYLRSLNEFAVLYRTNAQSRAIEEAFMASGIPYRIIGGFKFYDRKEVKDILAYLRLIQNPDEDISLRRIINIPKRGIGNSTMEAIENYARENDASLFEALLSIESIGGISKKALGNIKEFVKIITELMVIAEVKNPSFVLNELLNRSKIIEMLEIEEDKESLSRAENIKELLSATLEFEAKFPDANLEKFLENMALMSDIDNLETSTDAVVLMTMHSAKGLEYPYVFLAGLEQGLFPSQRAFFDEKQMEEERRLMYVGITRAKSKLYLSWAYHRILFGNPQYNEPSQFIKEIPKDLIIKV